MSITEFNVVGSADGLRAPDATETVPHHDVAHALPNSGGTVDVQYVSANVFHSDSAFHFEADGAGATYFSADYSLDAQGNITIARARSGTDGSAKANQNCHDMRLWNLTLL